MHGRACGAVLGRKACGVRHDARTVMQVCCKIVDKAYSDPFFASESMSTTTQYPGHPSPVSGPGAISGGTSHAKVAPGEIAVGVVVGRASEYFDFFVFGI